MNSYQRIMDTIKRIDPEGLTDGEVLDLIYALLDSSRS